jgi:hypothetical protein
VHLFTIADPQQVIFSVHAMVATVYVEFYQPAAVLMTRILCHLLAMISHSVPVASNDEILELF